MKASRAALAKEVRSHLKEDMKEYRGMIRDDKNLLRTLKKGASPKKNKK